MFGGFLQDLYVGSDGLITGYNSVVIELIFNNFRQIEWNQR